MKDNIKTYTLRPHHGMCLAFFIGEGYSDAFTKNMVAVLELLEEEGAIVELKAECDEICRACPNKKDTAEGGSSGKTVFCCISEKKVAAYDRAVLKACGLKEGETISFAEFTALVQEKVIASGKRKEICKSCRWRSICENVKSRWG